MLRFAIIALSIFCASAGACSIEGTYICEGEQLVYNEAGEVSLLLAPYKPVTRMSIPYLLKLKELIVKGM